MRACLLLACLAATVLAASASARTLHYQVTVVVNGPGHVTGNGRRRLDRLPRNSARR